MAAENEISLKLYIFLISAWKMDTFWIQIAGRNSKVNEIQKCVLWIGIIFWSWSQQNIFRFYVIMQEAHWMQCLDSLDLFSNEIRSLTSYRPIKAVNFKENDLFCFFHRFIKLISSSSIDRKFYFLFLLVIVPMLIALGNPIFKLAGYVFSTL